jgi:hypothetical protein
VLVPRCAIGWSVMAFIKSPLNRMVVCDDNSGILNSEKSPLRQWLWLPMADSVNAGSRQSR